MAAMIMVAKTGWLTLIRVRNMGSVLNHFDLVARLHLGDRGCRDHVPKSGSGDLDNAAAIPALSLFDRQALQFVAGHLEQVETLRVLANGDSRHRYGILLFRNHDLSGR